MNLNELIAKQPQRLPMRSSHPYHMYDMMSETGQALDRILSEEKKAIEKVAAKLSPMKKVLFVGIGTSYHAALNAKYYFKSIAQIDCEAVNSFEFIMNTEQLSLYPADTTAVVIFSHKGFKTYSYQAYTTTNSLGYYSVLLTSTESVIEQKDIDIIRTSRLDQSSAFTISHTSSAFCTLLLANWIAKNKNLKTVVDDSEIAKIPGFLEVLRTGSEASCKAFAKQATQQKMLYFLSYGANESNAPEVTLKINEATWMYAQGFQLEQYIHGPWVATDPTTLSTYIVGSTNPKYKMALDRTAQSAKSCINVNAKVSAIVPEDEQEITEIVSSSGGVVIKTPVVSEPLTLLLNLYTLQLLTYWLAIERGINPDTFRRDQPLYDTTLQKSGLTL